MVGNAQVLQGMAFDTSHAQNRGRALGKRGDGDLRSLRIVCVFLQDLLHLPIRGDISERDHWMIDQQEVLRRLVLMPRKKLAALHAYHLDRHSLWRRDSVAMNITGSGRETH